MIIISCSSSPPKDQADAYDVHLISNGYAHKRKDSSANSSCQPSPKSQKTSETFANSDISQGLGGIIELDGENLKDDPSSVYGSSADLPILILDSDPLPATASYSQFSTINLKNSPSTLYGSTPHKPIRILDSDANDDGYQGHCNLNQKDVVVIEDAHEFQHTPLTGVVYVEGETSKQANEMADIPIIILDSEDTDANTGYPHQKDSLIQTAHEIPEMALTRNDPEESEASNQANESAREEIVNDTQFVKNENLEESKDVPDSKMCNTQTDLSGNAGRSIAGDQVDNPQINAVDAYSGCQAYTNLHQKDALIESAYKLPETALIRNDPEKTKASKQENESACERIINDTQSIIIDKAEDSRDVLNSEVCNIQIDLRENAGMSKDTPQINAVEDSLAKMDCVNDNLSVKTPMDEGDANTDALDLEVCNIQIDRRADVGMSNNTHQINAVDDSLAKIDSVNDNLSVKTPTDEGDANTDALDSEVCNIQIDRRADVGMSNDTHQINAVDDSLAKIDSVNDNLSVKTPMDDGDANNDALDSKMCNIQTYLSANSSGMSIAGEVINVADDSFAKIDSENDNGAASAANDMLMRKDNHQIDVEDNIVDGLDDGTDDRVCRKFKPLKELGLASSNIQLDDIVHADVDGNYDQVDVEDDLSEIDAEDDLSEIDVEDDLSEIWNDMAVALEYSKDSSANLAATGDFTDECREDCEHSLILKEDIGYVCRICGVIQRSIDTILEFQFYKGKRSTRTYESRSANDKDSTDVTPSLVTSHDLTITEILAHPSHRKHMKHHQVEGFNFLCTNLISDNPGGCILAHAPGSGKTFMIISFIQSFLARYPDARPLVVLPKGILPIWKNEFLKWQVEEIPLHDFYTSKAENRSQQLSVLRKWVKKKSIFFLGYTQFSAIVCDTKSEIAVECRDILLKVPTVLILDEGHTPRNETTDVVQSLSRVQTPRKVVLSGTLYQNNVKEVFNVVNLVRPQFLKLNTSKMIVNRIMSRVNTARKRMKSPKSGLHSAFYESVEYTLQKDEDSKSRNAVIQDLREMTRSILHYYKGDFLDELPGLVDFTVVLNLSPKQKDEAQMLTKLDMFKRTSLGSAIYIHPVLKSFSQVSSATVDGEKIDEILEGLDVREGVKAKFFLNILGLCESTREKLLVFSQYIMPLKLLERLSAKVKGWRAGKELFMITGDSNADERERCMEQFNGSAEARVFFGSIKACGEGISLVGASRILILDVHLNPSVTRQAIGRAFRPGQAKKVFTYRLIAADSPEQKDNQTCSRKELISKMWFEWNQYSKHQDFEMKIVDPNDCEDTFFQSPGLKEDLNVLYKR